MLNDNYDTKNWVVAEMEYGILEEDIWLNSKQENILLQGFCQVNGEERNSCI